jgi:hypothetical protein
MGLHCLSVTTMSHQANSVARMSQNFHYIPNLGMEKGGVTLFISDYNEVVVVVLHPVM